MYSPSDRPESPSAGPKLLCPICEAAALVGRHCKRLCPGCGYVESCEDNFLPNQRNPDETGRCRLGDGGRGDA